MSNLQNFIDSFKTSLKDCNNKFSNIQDTFLELVSSNQSKKIAIDGDVLKIRNDILSQLTPLNDFDLDEQIDKDQYGVQLNDIQRNLDSFKIKFEEIQCSFVKLKDKSTESSGKLPSVKEPEESGLDENLINSNRVFPVILKSRQTNCPFILKTMELGDRYKCSGCKENISIKCPFLSHTEEYPSGSNTYLPHSYHISQECLIKRGFSSTYLMNIDVNISEAFTIDNDILSKIGFDIKNIHMKNSIPKGVDWNTISDDDVPDNISEASYVSSKCDAESSQVNMVTMFFYNRKNPDQKKVYICQGCQLPIEAETYLTYQKNPHKMFHIKKSCLQSSGVYPVNFSRVVVKVGKLLKTHGDLKELLACGFYYNKIIGFRPNHPNAPPEPLKKKPSAERASVKQPPHEVEFLFNNEPFYCQRLSRGEKCASCNVQIRMGEILLRHQEKIPRERLKHRPLISQYYHVNKQCLLSRGFSLKYLGSSTCNVILSGEDNLSRIKDCLVKCGFENEKISYSYKSSEDLKGFEAAPLAEEPVKNQKLFVDCCTNSVKCVGCDSWITSKQKCYIYSTAPVQNSQAKLFHIEKGCLELQFTKDEIMGLTCVYKNSLDVSPNDIFNCGIIKIVNDISLGHPVTNSNRRNKKPKDSVRTPLMFCVDIVLDNKVSCHVCKKTFTMDKHVLKRVELNQYIYIHVDPNCVKGLGLSPSELANARLSYFVYVSHEDVTKLKACGFVQFPKN